MNRRSRCSLRVLIVVAASSVLASPTRAGATRMPAGATTMPGGSVQQGERPAAQGISLVEALAAADLAPEVVLARAEEEVAQEGVATLLGAGRATRLDDSPARAEAALASAEGESAEQLRAAAAASLDLLLGRPAGEVLATAGEAPRPAPGGSLEEVRARALARSAEARAAEARVGAAEARLALARKQRLPALALEAGADIHDPTQEGTDSFAGVTVTLAQGGAARERVAQAERDVAALDLERIRRTA